MAFPEYVPTRVVTVGGAISVEDADSLLRVAVEIRSSHSLIWDATGYRFEKTGKAAISELGTEVSVILPRTDVDGWKDAATGAYIDVSEPDSYTHRYTAVIRFINQDGRTIGTTYTVGPFVLPAGTGAVDLDKMVPASSIPGGQVSIPDVWGQMVAAAEAAAAAAEAALIDSDSFIASQITTPATETRSALEDTLASTVAWAKNPDTLVSGALTYSGGLLQSAAVVWPDGATGTFTITSRQPSTDAVTGYTITRVTDSGTKTYTQPTITRDSSGAATNVPQIVVS
ncbi:hypothetical protein [Microbacterium kunmingense]|uniref:hypothetical protein n=1 Tax=Microbacterium kunmingense TaxID=2915939 RepID=UPI003D71CDD5